MNGRDAARMARVPSLHEIERLAAANLPDDDPVRAQPPGRSDESFKRYALRRAQGDRVFCFAPQLSRVFENDNPLIVFCDFSEK